MQNGIIGLSNYLLMRKTTSILFLLFVCLGASAQSDSIGLKVIPEAMLKFGSQKPMVGGQFNFVAGAVIEKKYFAGIGVGYCTDIGMNGSTIPLYADGRFYFSLPKPFLFKSKDASNDFQLEVQIGMNLNNNKPFKHGLIAGGGLAYKFDFIKIKEFKLPSFYAGVNVEYNYNRFKDEYRGYLIQDGVLKHLILNIKVAIDIKPINL